MATRRARQTTSDRTSLADALFSATQRRVLGLLFGQPEQSFFASQVISIAGGGSGAVQRELARLEQSGLVTSNRLGNQKHYQANPASPIFQELRGIVSKTLGVADPIRGALESLAPRIDWAVIYGSIAKKTDTAGSDIDVMIVADQVALEEIFKALDPVERQLHRKINPTLLTKSEFTRRIDSGQGFVTRVVEGDYIPLMGGMDAAKATRQSRSHRKAQGRSRRQGGS